MWLINHLALFAGLLSAASAFDQVEDTSFLAARQGGCVKGVHVVAAGRQGATKGNLGYLASLAHGIVNRIPHSELHQIAYPPNEAEGATAIGYGVPALHKHIMAFSARCPKTKIVTIGYSIGGAITMDVLCGAAANGDNALADKYRKNILANVVYGDLTFLPGKTYDRGTCTLPGKVPRQKPGKCFPFGRKTHSYCDTNDPECCSGNDPNVHFTYPDKYDQDAIDFVHARWRRYRGN